MPILQSHHSEKDHSRFHDSSHGKVVVFEVILQG